MPQNDLSSFFDTIRLGKSATVASKDLSWEAPVHDSKYGFDKRRS